MPVYCYETEKTKKIVERVFPIGKAPKIVYHQGEKACRCLQAEAVSVPSSSGWPIACYASGVHASQAGELREFLKKSGVPTEVTADGDPVYRNARHRRKALKARGLFDKSAFI
jgi:hypothetical protein